MTKRSWVLLFVMWLLAIFAPLLRGETMSTVFNLTVDIKGEPDTRPGTTGLAGVADQALYAIVPAGSRLHILHVIGDVVAWPVGAPAVNSKAGILWGLKPSGPIGTEHWTTPGGSDDTFVYVQGAVSEKIDVTRVAVDQDVNSYLGSDNMLMSRLSVWMNDTGVPIHVEATFKLTYEITGPPQDVRFHRTPIGGTVVDVPHLLIHQERYDGIQFSERRSRFQ